MTKHHVIIGAGPAGVSAMETLRAADAEARITLVSDEPAYARMALPYFLSGEIPESQTYIATPEYLRELRVEAKFGKRVASVDGPGRSLAFVDRERLPFDTLLIATGSSAVKPNVPGIDGADVYNLWTIEDARQVVARAAKGKRVTMIGAGFIGLIVLNALHKLGCDLTVVEIEGQVLPRMLDAESARLVGATLARRGVRVVTGRRVTEIESNGGAKVLRLERGGSVIADLVISAAGVRPNVAFLAGSGISVDHGVLVDDHLRTNYPWIYAAGDCAQGPDFLTGAKSVHAIQPTAVDHGRVAGANMAGGDIAYRGSLSMNVLEVCGLQCVSYGLWRGEGKREIKLVNPDRPIYRKMVFDGDVMIGAIFVGPAKDITMLNDVGMTKGFIWTRVKLGRWLDHLERNPLDLRRAFFGAKVSEALRGMTTLGRPSVDRAFRFGNQKPWTKMGAAHEAFVRAIGAEAPGESKLQMGG